MPDRPTVDPTEISISPIRIAISIPQLIIAFTELDFSRFNIFEVVKNLGVDMVTTIIKRIKPIIVPIFRLKKYMPGILFFSVCISRPPASFLSTVFVK